MAGCQAEPPPLRPGTQLPPGSGNYASVARCSPAFGPQQCPGSGCGESAIGAPDGVSVELSSCGTLDVAFTAGNVLAVIGKPDIAIHTPTPPQGSARIEASSDGVAYRVVGFLRAVPPGTSSYCLAVQQGTRALVDVSLCNLVSNVNFIRISPDGPGSVSIDAIEALSIQLAQ